MNRDSFSACDRNFIARFATWAEARPDIRLAFMVGSQARSVYPGDAWSDLDFVLFTTDLDAYTLDVGWLSELGTVWAATLDAVGSGEPEWLVVYEGGLDADFAFALVGGELAPEIVLDTFGVDLFRRGAHPLVDKDDIFPRLPSLSPLVNPLPDEWTFTNTVHRFWRYVERAAKKLRRGELWMAKSLCDDTLKTALLHMIEWHARALHGPQYDTWYDGHFLEQWADPRALAGLRDAFARYDAEDVWRALFATSELFRWLARETADRLGYVYPAETDTAISAWVEQLFAERG